MDRRSLAWPMVSEEHRSDAELIAASLDDPQLFREIFIRHRAAIYRFLARRVGSQDAEDLLDIVFRKAFTARTGFLPGNKDSLPWLYGIAANTVGDFLRQQRPQILLYPIDTIDNLPASPDSDPANILLRNEFSEALNAALSSIPAKYRDALLLHELEGLSYDEVGLALGVPVNTVASRIHRAKRKLASLLINDNDRAGLRSAEGGAHERS